MHRPSTTAPTTHQLAGRRSRQSALGALTLVAVLALAGCAADEPAAPATSDAGIEVPTAAPGDTPSDALAAALQDVGTAAPRLESFYRGGQYPQEVAEVEASLADAGVTLTDGNVIGGYAYDADAVEFELCVETPDGAYATYDTAPMSVRLQGESGGCPAL